MGYLVILGLAALDFFEAVKVVTLRLRLRVTTLVPAPSALRACGTFTLMTSRSKTPQSRLRRASETWLALRLNARQDFRHLRCRFDAGRLALMGRAEQRAALRQPADEVLWRKRSFRTASDASHPAAPPPTLRGILRSLRLLRIARCPRWPTIDCSAASLLRNRRRSQPLSAAADIPFQGNSRPLRPRRRSSCCFSRLLALLSWRA